MKAKHIECLRRLDLQVLINLNNFTEPTGKKGRGRPKGGSKKVELPKGYASYDSEDFDFTSSEEELPEPKLSRSGRPIRPVFQSELF